MVMPLPGGRRMHVAEGELKEALLAWIKDANGAEKLARHEHAVKHRKYYVPVDIMYVGAMARGVRKLAGSPFRAKYKPTETCPVCALVRAIERARIDEQARQRRAQVDDLRRVTPGGSTEPMKNGERGVGKSREPQGSETGESRLITYEMGREVENPLGGTVRVLAVEDRVDWRTTDGGTIEPDKGSRFCRLRVSLLNRGSRDDIGLVADAFSLDLTDGSHLEPVDERYGPDELQGRYGEYVEQGQRLEGWIYYELATAGTAAYALFETGWSKDTVGPVIRWDLRRSRREAAGAQYSLHVQSLGGADASRIALLIERYLEQDFRPERFAVLPCTIVEGISYATAEPLRASLERAGVAVEMAEHSNSA